MNKFYFTGEGERQWNEEKKDFTLSKDLCFLKPDSNTLLSYMLWFSFELDNVMGWTVFPPELITPNATVFGDRGLEVVIKVKWGHRSRTLLWLGWSPGKKRKRHRMRVSHMHAPRKGHRRAQREGSHVQTRKRALSRNRISQHLDLGLSSYQNWEI